jgi:hypothetical protein
MRLVIQRDPDALYAPYAEHFPLEMDVPLRSFLNIVDTVQRIGVEGIKDILRFPGFVEKVLETHGIASTDDQAAIFEDMLSQIQKEVPPPNERALLWTYREMQEHGITYTEAAQLASEMLGQEIPRDVWRLRLARWIKTRKLPPINARQGRPPINRRQ